MVEPKFKVGSKVIIEHFYKNIITKEPYTINNIQEDDIAKSIMEHLPGIIKRSKEGSDDHEIYVYGVELFNGKIKDFFEAELRLAKITNWKDFMEEGFNEIENR
jgi:hypothetical protein